MESEKYRRAVFWRMGSPCAVAAGIVAVIIHVLIWCNAAPLLVTATLRVLLWIFVLSLVGVVAANREGDEAGYIGQKLVAYKWLLLPLLILWLAYSGVLAYSTVSSPSATVLRRVQGTPYTKIYQLWSSSAYMLTFIAEGLYWRLESRSDRGN